MKLTKAIDWYEKAKYNWAKDKGHYEWCIREIGKLVVKQSGCEFVSDYKEYDRKIKKLTREAVESRKSSDGWFELCKDIERKYDVLD